MVIIEYKGCIVTLKFEEIKNKLKKTITEKKKKK